MKSKKLFSLLLAVLVCVTAVFGNANVSKAAEAKEETLVLDNAGVATANTEATYNFTVDKSTDVYFDIFVPAVLNCNIAVVDNNTGQEYGRSSVSTTDWEYEGSVGAYYYYFTAKDMAVGDYTVKLTFDADTQFMFAVSAKIIPATLNQTKATISVGFTKTLKVDNTTEKVTWSSSKKSVATVSSKGVVKGVKAGTAKITAKVGDQKLTCTITVKANAYSEKKLSAASVPYGCALQVYKASYASNGDLTLKCRFINNSAYQVTALKNMKITFKTNTGKTVGTYTAKSKSMSVSAGSTKDFTVTIKKAKLKNKKADLRLGDYSTSGSYQYRY